MVHVLTTIKSSSVSANNEAVAICRDLGLKIQEQRYAVGRRVEDSFTPMTNDELLLWRWYCPKPYGTDPEFLVTPSKLENYAFDTIPVEVLKHWSEIKKNYAFDSFQIRTTERTANSDPLLIGNLGQACYLLARWGNDSPDLLSLKDVAVKLCQSVSSLAWYPFQSERSRIRQSAKHIPQVAAALRILNHPDAPYA